MRCKNPLDLYDLSRVIIYTPHRHTHGGKKWNEWLHFAHSLCFPRTFKLVIIITRGPLNWGRNIWYLTLSHCDRLELLWENSKICYIATQKSSITFLSIVMLSIPNTPFSTHYPCLPMQIQAIHTEPRAGQRRTCLLQQQCTVLEGWLCSGQPPYFVSSPS